MAQALVSQAMRDFLARNQDTPIENSKLQHNSEGELVVEEVRGRKARYLKSSANGDWEELVLPFDDGSA